MAKNMTREELLQELAAALDEGLPAVGENEIPLVEIAKAQGTKTDVIERRFLKSMPPGWEIVERRGYNGHRTKCARKVDV